MIASRPRDPGYYWAENEQEKFPVSIFRCGDKLFAETIGDEFLYDLDEFEFEFQIMRWLGECK